MIKGTGPGLGPFPSIWWYQTSDRLGFTVEQMGFVFDMRPDVGDQLTHIPFRANLGRSPSISEDQLQLAEAITAV
mgnify:CR=1 FL=1